MHDAFISYSRKDKKFAKALERALESFRPPRGLKLPQRHLDVFRDEDDFTGVEYHQSVATHLRESAKLIVLCSPNSRASQYVNDEINRFAATRGADHIIPILIGGIPNNEATAEQDEQKAFPQALCEAMQMPLAADYRHFDSGKDKLSKGVFYGAWYTTLANILGVSRSQIEQRDQKRIARRRTVIVGGGAGIIVVLSIALIVTVLARREAEHRRFVSLAQALTSQALFESTQGQHDRAALLARQAYLIDQRHQGEVLAQVDAALRRVMKSEPFTLASKGSGKVNAIAVSGDGTLLAAGGDHLIRLWNLANPAAKPRILDGHSIEVVSVAFSPDGRTLASGSWDQTVRLWGLASPDAKPRVLRGHDDYVLAVAFSPDGKVLASAGRDSTVQIWDLSDANAEPRTLPGPRRSVSCLAFGPDGKTLASGGLDGTIQLWNMTTPGAPPTVLRGQEEGVRSIAFSRDGKTLAAAVGRTLALWDLKAAAGEPVLLGGHDGDVTSVAFSPDGTVLASGELGSTVRLRALSNLDAAPAVLDTHAENVSAIAYGADGATLVSASYDGTIQRWTAQTQAIADLVCRNTRRNLAVEEWERFVAADLPYERTCRNRPLHPTFVMRGEELAREGRIDAAVAVFRRAAELDPDQVFSNPEQHAMRFAAEGLVLEGERLARSGDVERAVASFRKALEKNPGLTLDPEPKAKAAAASALVARGESQAHQGNLDEAIALLSRAKQLDPGLGFDPNLKPKPAVASSLVKKGAQLASRGRVKEAIAAFQQAQALYPELRISAESWNILCWNGSVWGHAADVLSACDRAIAVGTDESENAGSWDSRGVARALVGDRAGALEDFRTFVDLARYREVADEVVAERRAWIRALEKGEDPITPEVMEALRRP
jgi:WD40 repeat protein